MTGFTEQLHRCSIGICYEGGLDAKGKPKDTRTIAQRGSLVKLLIELKQKFPKAAIRGHNEMPGATIKECPCFRPSTEFAYLMNAKESSGTGSSTLKNEPTYLSL